MESVFGRADHHAAAFQQKFDRLWPRREGHALAFARDRPAAVEVSRLA